MELLIVIVIIAILASITIVAYNGIQARANDSSIQTTAAQLQKAILLWRTDTGILPAAGYGSTGPAANDACPGNTATSGGWFQSGPYPCSMEDLLRARGLLQNKLSASLPKNNITNSSSNVFMLYPCNNRPGQYVLYWYLNNPSAADNSNLDSIASVCSGLASRTNLSQYATYGMRAGVIINLN